MHNIPNDQKAELHFDGLAGCALVCLLTAFHAFDSFLILKSDTRFPHLLYRFFPSLQAFPFSSKKDAAFTASSACRKSSQTFLGMYEGAVAPSYFIVSTGFAGRAGRFFGASAQKNHFRSLAMQDELFHPAWSVSKKQLFDTQKGRRFHGILSLLFFQHGL